MKSYVVLIVLAAGVAVATALYAYNTRKPAELDMISQSLKGARSMLPPGSRISFKGEPSKSELLSWSRYAMAPHFLDAKGRYDTTLLVRYKANSDSSLVNAEDGRIVFWQHTDSIYHYSLSRTP